MRNEQVIRREMQEAVLANDQARIKSLADELRRLQLNPPPVDPAQKRINDSFSVPSLEDQAEVETVMPRLNQATNPETGEPVRYTPRDLLERPEAMDIIRKYMHSFEGIGTEMSDEEVVDKWLFRMRSFASGNSITTLNEVFSIQKADDNKKAVAGQAYDLFDQMAGVFSDDYTWGEMFGGLGSYARATIVDPVNLLGVGVGKAVTHAGAKGSSAAVRTLAAQAAKQATKKALARGVAKEAAEELGNRAASRVVQKAAQSAAIKTGVKSQALKEIAVATGVDATAAVGIDAAYQWGLIETGSQEEYSPFQSGLTALGAIGAGVLDVGLMGLDKGLARQTTGTIESVAELDRTRVLTKQLSEGVDLVELNRKLDPENFKPWEVKVEEGLPLEKMGYGSIENYKWTSFMLGRTYDDGTTQEGLAHVLRDSGFRTILPRYQGDNLTSQMGDFVLQMPEDAQKKLLSAFKKTMGEKHYRGWNIDDFVNHMSAEWHTAGQKLNIQSQSSKVLGQLGVDPENVSVKDALRTLQVPIERTSTDKSPRKLAFFQNALIQTIVSHPATTALNVIGSAQRMGVEILSDVVRAGLYTTYGAKGLVDGNWDSLNRGIRIAKSTKGTMGAILRPEATKLEFEKMMEMRPETEQALFRWLSGGVDATENTLKEFNIDPNTKWGKFAKGTDAYKNFAQKAYFVQAQDRVFKSTNFMRHLNRNMLEEYGMSYSDFMNQAPETVIKEMNSERYAKVELLSVDQTNASVFSKSYSSKDAFSKNPLHYAATAIEQFRRWPIVGAMMPFGQFFNNTIDFMADYSGAKLAYRLWPIGEKATADELVDATAKGAVGIGVIYGLSLQEEEGIRDGLAWSEYRDATGAVRDYTYDFPGSAFKMAARMVAHRRLNEEIPENLWEEAARTFGPEALTRGFNQPFENLSEDLGKALSEPSLRGKTTDTFKALVSHIGASWTSGYSRPIDPINQFVGATKEDGYVYLDRKSGEEWLNKSFRYVDQFMIQGLKALGATEKTPTFEGDNIQSIGKVTGYRTVQELSPGQKMFNSIERPYFMDKVRSQIPEADNAVRELLQDRIDENAIKLMNSKNWNKLNMKSRTSAVESVVRSSVDQAKRELRRSLKVEDRRLATLFDMKQEFGEGALQRAFSELGFNEVYSDISELDFEQLRELRAEAKALPRRDRVAPTQNRPGTLLENNLR